jgi:hypothetical protein
VAKSLEESDSWFQVLSTTTENNELQNELHDVSILSTENKSFLTGKTTTLGYLVFRRIYGSKENLE